jgi:hypothetical protein
MLIRLEAMSAVDLRAPVRGFCRASLVVYRSYILVASNFGLLNEVPFWYAGVFFSIDETQYC